MTPIHMPTDSEIQIIVARAQKMRGEALAQMFASLWARVASALRIPRAYRHI